MLLNLQNTGIPCLKATHAYLAVETLVISYQVLGSNPGLNLDIRSSFNFIFKWMSRSLTSRSFLLKVIYILIVGFEALQEFGRIALK